MTADLVGTLRAIVRDELARLQPPELGVVTQVFPRDGGGSDNNHEVNVRLRASGVELQRVPVLVGRLGLSALPNEGDLMLLTFVGHDLNAPVAVGCVYDDKQQAPIAKAHEVVYLPPDDEASDVRRVHIELKSGSAITLNDDKLQILFGDTTIVVNKDGDVVIKSAGALQVETEGDIAFESKGSIALTAQTNLALKGLKATVEASAQATIKGAQISLAGLTQFSPS